MPMRRLRRVCARESLFEEGMRRQVGSLMDRALSARPGFLNNFEIAQIMYLRPEKVDVAVALIPR